MLSRLPMNRKLLFTLLPVVTAILILVLLFVRQAVQEAVTAEALASVQSLAALEGERVVGTLHDEWEALTAIATIDQVDDMLSVEQREAALSAMLRAHLAQRPHLLRAWSAWPAADGVDRGGDASGWRRAEVGASPERLDGITWGDREQALEQSLVQGSRLVATDPHPATGRQDEHWVVTLAVPLNAANHEAGLVAVEMSLNGLQESVTGVQHNAGVTALFGQTGAIIAHPDVSRLGQLMEDTEADFMAEELPAAVSAVTAGESYVTVMHNDLFGEEALIVFEPAPLGGESGAWSFAMAMPMSEVLEAVTAIEGQVIVIGLSGLAGLMVVILLLARGISRPLETAALAMEDVAGGEGDLTRRLEVKGADELARLGRAFNAFAEQVRGVVAQVAAHCETLTDTATRLQETSTVASSGVEQQRTEVAALAAGMEQLSTTVQQVAGNAQEGTVLTRSGRQEVDAGQGVIQQMVNTIGQQAGEVQGTSEKLQQLQLVGHEIESIIGAIQGIAEQTNLLALNTSIEAARAGEHGRGFAVVADEVRGLAGRTRSATEEIGAMIARLQEQTVEAVVAMNGSKTLSEQCMAEARPGLSALERIADQMQEVEAMNLQVASATEQQSATTGELARNTARLGGLADEAAKGARETAEGSRALGNLALELRELVARFRY